MLPTVTTGTTTPVSRGVDELVFVFLFVVEGFGKNGLGAGGNVLCMSGGDVDQSDQQGLLYPPSLLKVLL